MQLAIMKLTNLKPRITVVPSRLTVMKPNSWRNDKQTSTERGYGYKWQQARAAYLSKYPLCVFCERDGRVTSASVVDHSVPHRGDMTIFWDSSKWQSLCASCHSSAKQREENQWSGS